MRQVVFEFVAQDVGASGIPMDARLEEELVARMAEAIMAVIQAQGERNDE